MTILDGMIRVFKPPGWTSHDVVNLVRRTLAVRKVGHTGTLDPGAAGLLLVLVGRGTKAQRYFDGLGKRYVAELTLGLETDTGDGFGQVIRVDESPPDDPGAVREVLAQFVGDVQQIPPMTSAVKRRGVPLYRLARRGIEVKREPRRVRIQSLRLLEWRGGPPPRALLEISCSPGTYVRTLMADLAAAAGSCGYMSFLVRTAVGGFAISGSAPPGDICRERVMPLRDALGFLPAVRLDAADARLVSGGARPRGPRVGDMSDGDRVRLLDARGELLAVGAVSSGRIHPERVFVRPDDISGERAD
ncbi:MAG: tRNA pseudouridine(55) synthase TruB [Bacillota bacterium]